MTSLPETFYAARYRLTRRYPYLSQAVLAMTPRVSTDCPTMGVDASWRLYVNPTFVSKLSVEQIEAIIYHEVLHLLFDHSSRRDAISANHELFNIAADLEINDNIDAEGFDLIPTALRAALFDLPSGLLAEEYYHRIRDMADAFPTPDNPLNGLDGSGAGGEPQPWEEPADSTTHAVSPATAEVIRQATARHVTTAGDTPAGLARWASATLDSKVDWRRVLRSRLRQAIAWSAGQTDYRYDRPGRRQSAMPRIVTPRLVSPQTAVAVVIDTSGSMREDQLGQALAELGGVLRVTGAPVDVYAGDVGVQSLSRVLRPGQVTLTGGGGTDMGLALTEVAASRKRYGLVVVLTDGYTPWTPDRPGPWPVIVTVLGNGPDAPAWATMIRIEEDA